MTKPLAQSPTPPVIGQSWRIGLVGCRLGLAPIRCGYALEH
jgi:hypothetical protein